MFAHLLAALLLATSAPSSSGEVKPAAAAAQVRASALPLAARLKVTLGRPSCPSGVPVKAGAMFQCTVGLGEAAVPYAVTVQPDGTLAASQLWAVLSTSSISAVAGPRAACGQQKTIARAVGSAVKCTVGGATVRVVITSLDGSLMLS